MPPPPSLHVAQFYEDDEFLVEFLVNFVQAGLQNNETVIIIATAPHIHMLRHTLTSADLCNPRLSFFDTTTVLSELMVQDWPDHSAFMRLLGHPIQEACHRGRVRVYGEMVAVLWSTGRYQETLCLEGLWNTLLSTQSFALLHAYPRMPYACTPGADPITMLAVYHAHSHVLHQNPGSAVRSTH
jgi:hypothetical protein